MGGARRRGGSGEACCPAGLATCVSLAANRQSLARLRMLFVQSEFQGFGIGRALVLRLLEEARSMGYSTMRLDTWRHMVSAHRDGRPSS